MTIIEGQPIIYRAHDGALIELAVAGRDRVFTLTINGERQLTTHNEEYARAQARNASVEHNARGTLAGAR